MAEALLAPFAMAAALLALAGLLKLRSPLPTREALRAMGAPATTAIARAVGLAELAVGGACLLASSEAARAALAGAYLALAASTALRLLRGDRGAPCGCFGVEADRLHGGHLLVNLFCLLAAAGAIAAPPPSALEALHQGTGIVLMVSVGCSVYLVLALLRLFPEAWRAYGGGGA